MSSELESRSSDVSVVLGNAPQLRGAYGKILGAILTWKALSAVKPRSIFTAIAIAILSAVAGHCWPK